VPVPEDPGRHNPRSPQFDIEFELNYEPNYEIDKNYAKIWAGTPNLFLKPHFSDFKVYGKSNQDFFFSIFIKKNN